jgi:hypothetical protein
MAIDPTLPMTIRNLATWWNVPVEELLDIPITVGVHGGKNFESYTSTMRSPGVHRFVPGGDTPGELRFEAVLRHHRLTRKPD